MKMLAATAQHLLELDLERTEGARRWKINRVDPWMSGHTFATAAQYPNGGVLTIHHANTLDAAGGKMQDMYVVQFAADGGIIDRGKNEGLRHAHSAEVGNGHLYITNTAFNQLIYSPTDGSVGHIAQIGPEGMDTHHINSTFVDGSTVYVMCHNGNLPEDVPSQIMVLDHSEDDPKPVGVIDLPHRLCHNIIVENEVLYYLASDDGRVIRYDPETLEWEDLVIGGFPKGLIRVDESTLACGTSEHTPFVERRVESHAQLCFIDLKRWKVEEILELTVANRGAGQINDLELLA